MGEASAGVYGAGGVDWISLLLFLLEMAAGGEVEGREGGEGSGVEHFREGGGEVGAGEGGY